MREKADKISIVLMTKMALYDKKAVERDERKLAFFRHDYIYKKNASLRLGVLFGFLILVILYAMKLFAIDNVNFEEMFLSGAYKALLVRIGVYFVAAEVGYTALGTLIYSVEYQKARKAATAYFETAEKLEKRRTKLAARAKKMRDLAASGELGEYAPSEMENFWEEMPGFGDEETAKKESEDEDLDAVPPPFTPSALVYKKSDATPKVRSGLSKSEKYRVKR